MLRFCSLCYFSSRHVRKGKRCCAMLHIVASVADPARSTRLRFTGGGNDRQSQGPPASHVDTAPLPDAAISSGSAKRRTSTTSCSRSFVCSANRLRRIKASPLEGPGRISVVGLGQSNRLSLNWRFAVPEGGSYRFHQHSTVKRIQAREESEPSRVCPAPRTCLNAFFLSGNGGEACRFGIAMQGWKTLTSLRMMPPKQRQACFPTKQVDKTSSCNLHGQSCGLHLK
jgi:hypothetical protein